MAAKLRLGVLASGNGSNLQAIMDNCQQDRIPAEVVVVVSDCETAFALERARRQQIPALHLNPRSYASKADYEQALVEALQAYGVDVICLAGYMRLVGSTLLQAFPQRVLNIHPALLPAFPGLHGQAQAFAYGVKFAGCTVHFVDEGMDTGPIILQAVVPVLADDSAETLAARILVEEHKIYSQAIALLAEGKLKLAGRKVSIVD